MSYLRELATDCPSGGPMMKEAVDISMGICADGRVAFSRLTSGSVFRKWIP